MNNERRAAMRFDKVFPVRVESPLYGTLQCIARNVSSGGMFLETAEPLPLGAEVRVRFEHDGESIVARGEVKNHYFFNYSQQERPQSMCGMGVRFVGFEAGPPVDRILH
jgi:hypothetical protein